MNPFNDPAGRRLDMVAHLAPGTDALAAEWFVRQREGLGPAEERELKDWLAANPAHAEAFTRLAATAEIFQRARMTTANALIVARLEALARRRLVRRVVTSASATAALVLLAAVWSYRGETATSQSTVAGLTRPAEPIRRLPDGSLVELRAGAEIDTRYDAETRRVELLSGEALFRVEKDATRPFIVRAAGVEVRAVGTAFNVKLAPAALTVLVTEGRVQVNDANGKGSLLPKLANGDASDLIAGQEMLVEVVQSGQTPTSSKVMELTATEIKEALSWRISRLEFDGVRLADAVAKMNEQNVLQIVLADETTADLRVSGFFEADEPETFARLISRTFGLESQPCEGNRLLLKKR